MSKDTGPWVAEMHFVDGLYEPVVREYPTREEAEEWGQSAAVHAYCHHLEGGTVFIPAHQIARVVVARKDR
jgi:hypothetical protein